MSLVFVLYQVQQGLAMLTFQDKAEVWQIPVWLEEVTIADVSHENTLCVPAVSGMHNR